MKNKSLKCEKSEKLMFEVSICIKKNQKMHAPEKWGKLFFKLPQEDAQKKVLQVDKHQTWKTSPWNAKKVTNV